MWDLLEGSKFAVTHEEELTIKEDEGTLRQDRYSLRTAPQFIGPQVEDLIEALKTVTRECNTCMHCIHLGQGRVTNFMTSYRQPIIRRRDRRSSPRWQLPSYGR